MTYKYVHHFWQRFSPLSEIMNIFKGILGLLKMILFEPIWIHLVLGFGQSPFQVSENLNMMQDDDAMTSKANARAVTALLVPHVIMFNFF